jgi:hypothetical protein
MKTGRTLTELAAEIERQQTSKHDYEADSRAMEMVVRTDPIRLQEPRLAIEGIGEYDVSDHCHGQFADRLKIPKKYYDRMRSEAPGLLATNINHWFSQNPEKRMVRTLDGKARAFLSNRYRPLDNFDLAQVILPKFAEMQCRVESCELTETRMYFKAVTERISAQVVGDVVQAGIVVSNSEVGCGSLRVEPLLYKLACLNGMIVADASIRKYHIGRGAANGLEGAREFFRDSTREADDRAFWLKVRDTADAVLTQETFDRMVKRVESTSRNTIEDDPVKVVERVQEKFTLNDDERGGVLRHLIEGKDLSQWGLVNAITRTSQDVEDYDRATDLERLGGQVIELPSASWASLAQAS